MSVSDARVYALREVVEGPNLRIRLSIGQASLAQREFS